MGRLRAMLSCGCSGGLAFRYLLGVDQDTALLAAREVFVAVDGSAVLADGFVELDADTVLSGLVVWTNEPDGAFAVIAFDRAPLAD